MTRTGSASKSSALSELIPENPLSSLPLTAQKILRAAQKLLAERGYSAVTLENVATEAGVNKASIRYNFGNKAGLVTAVVDSLIHDEWLELKEDSGRGLQSDPVHAVIQSKTRMITANDTFRTFFDILPHALRDADLRERILSVYTYWYQENMKVLGLEGPGSDQDDLLAGIGQLMVAVVDGVSVQAGLDPNNYDLNKPLATLELLLKNSYAELRRRAGLPESSSP
jgi:AcrR family transcriptional regulator